jgi:hypothetical protein
VVLRAVGSFGRLGEAGAILVVRRELVVSVLEVWIWGGFGWWGMCAAWMYGI